MNAQLTNTGTRLPPDARRASRTLDSFWIANSRKRSARVTAVQLYALSPAERIGLVRQGVPGRFLAELATDMELPRDQVYRAIGLARSTVERKIRNDQRLSPDESERVLGIAQLVGQAHAMVVESGDPQGFDSARWVGQWFIEPHPALGGKAPSDFFDTAEGRALVSALLARQQSGAYA